jgi:hypothetical protein
MERYEFKQKDSKTGRLTLVLATATGGFGLIYVRSKVIVPGDAAATSSNIMASEFLYRAAIVSSLFSQIFMFFLGLTLFHLFKEVNRWLATVLFASVLISIALAPDQGCKGSTAG